MKIWLLTHSEELKKTSATGPLVKQHLMEECEVVTWSRVCPPNEILRLPKERTILVYLTDDTSKRAHEDDALNAEHIIVIDGTWQQARKMYNQSPYLQDLMHYQISGETSVFSKRRNQKEDGLCTAEVALHFLKKRQHLKTQALQQSFHEFNQ
ncbi:tRNA-uridine aminocarboxypropyltransferase [Marinomonas dokdonensis]|uniref:tRNA-uridine aminocarboxypropyltransferase n=1 Tax=Marinomonas dokdonensis TaxID=328224 RepID=UPI00405537C7